MRLPLLFSLLLRLMLMSLTSCPVCGYAVSTATFQCRHCPPGGAIKGISSARMAQIATSVAIAASVIYLIFFR
jgi:hypothetical protein